MKTHLTLLCAALAAGAAFTSTAGAQCSSMSPRLAAYGLTGMPASLPIPAVDSMNEVLRNEAKPQDDRADPSIGGMWMTTFTSGGQLVDQAFEVFHSDGTELMIDTAPPASDNVCMGAWGRTGSFTVKLNHPTWTFDDKGNLNGTATIKVDITVDPKGNSFTGKFTVDVFDLAGNTLQHLAGNVAAKRITVD